MKPCSLAFFAMSVFSVLCVCLPLAGGSPANLIFTRWCGYQHPLEIKDGLFIVKATVTAKNNKPLEFKFVLDTGSAETFLSPSFCPKAGCEVHLTYSSPILFELGNKEVVLKSPKVRSDLEILKDYGADGILGNDFLMSQDLILNFRDKSACFPKSPISELARALKFKRVSAKYDINSVWVDFKLNGKEIKNYYIDTGSNS